MQVLYTACIVMVIWALYGYSITFTGGFGLYRWFLEGVPRRRDASTRWLLRSPHDANISELVYFCFQMTFAAITPGLIVGAFAERTKFAAIALFIPLWVTLDLLPDRAHGLVLGWSGRHRCSRQGCCGRGSRCEGCGSGQA